MKAVFYAGLALLVLFEISNVYLIMPMPFSQQWNSIGLAYALYTWRWPIRLLAGLLVIAGLATTRTWGRQKWIAAVGVLIAAVTVYGANFVMAADAMFIAPGAVVMVPPARNVVPSGNLVIGLTLRGESRAYPVQYIGYHHQVSDTIGGTPILVTFCTVCRTGRIFSPVVEGTAEHFRLVGMDRFNAMFEDRSTGSWWRQATGEAIAGPRRGAVLRGIHSDQMTLAQWLALHPDSLVMQPDAALQAHYGKDLDYETGKSRSSLTGTDTSSWGEKSWVVGVVHGADARAYDWNRLRRERVINDDIGRQPIVLMLAGDDASFAVFERPADVRFTLEGDRLVAAGRSYDLSGRGAGESLTPVFASQEFWHSWRTFHPDTSRY